MAYHPGLNPIVHGTKISSAWMEYVEDSIDTAVSGSHVGPYSFVVRKNGAVYEAYANGVLTYGGASNAGGVDGTDASAVIQAALNNLTAGRTWKEHIHIKGSFTCATALEISSYTILTIDGALDFSAVDEDGLRITGAALARKREIEIYGGYIKGKGATSTKNGIRIYYSDFVRIHNVFVEDWYTGVYEYGCWVNCCIRDSQIAGNYVYNLVLDYSHTNTIENCDLSNNKDAAGASIRLMGIAAANHFFGCIIDNNEGIGIMMISSGDNVFDNCYFEANKDCDYYEEYDGGSANRSKNNQLKSCRFDVSDSVLRRFNIRAHQTQYLKILNCEFRNSFDWNYAEAAIWLDSTTIGTLIEGCSHYPSAGTYPLVGIEVNATAIIRNNPTWVTENGGFEEGTGAQQTIPHGCNFAPEYSEVILSNIDDIAGGNCRQTAAPDAANIYVTGTLNRYYRWAIDVSRRPAPV